MWLCAMNACVFVCGCVHLCGSQIMSVPSFLGLRCIFEAGSLATPGSHKLANWPPHPTCFCIQCQGCRCTQPCLALCVHRCLGIWSQALLFVHQALYHWAIFQPTSLKFFKIFCYWVFNVQFEANQYRRGNLTSLSSLAHFLECGFLKLCNFCLLRSLKFLSTTSY